MLRHMDQLVVMIQVAIPTKYSSRAGMPIPDSISVHNNREDVVEERGFNNIPSKCEKMNGDTTRLAQHDVIDEHVRIMHRLSNKFSGVMVVSGYGQNPETGEHLPGIVGQFEIGNMQGMTQFIKSHMNCSHLNLYMAPAIYRHGLSSKKRGSKKDIIAVLGLVADFDDERACEYLERMPLTPDYVLETSQERFQAFYLLDEPASPEEAEEVAKPLKARCECDHGTADINHVWRIPGTLNWPNKKKVDSGRSRTPQLVKVVKQWVSP